MIKDRVYQILLLEFFFHAIVKIKSFLIKKDRVDSGVYASVDEDGTPIVQFFVDKDDAIMYNTMLEAIDQHICITEVDSEMVDKFCGAMGHAYTVAEEGSVIVIYF